MKIEPPEFTDPYDAGRKEMPLFRVVISHHQSMLYLFFCAIFFCAYYFAASKIHSDPYALILQFFLGGWALSLLSFLFAFLMFVYNRILVSTQRVYGIRFALLHRHFSVRLTDITSVTVAQHFFAGPLHYGRIRIRTHGMTLHFPFVKEPAAVKDALDKAILQAGRSR